MEQFQRLVSLGVEKVAISAAAVENPNLVSQAAAKVGEQSVVVVMDVRKGPDADYALWTHNGSKGTGHHPVEFAERMQNVGARRNRSK